MKYNHLMPRSRLIIKCIVIPLIILCGCLLSYSFYRNYIYNTHAIKEAEQSIKDSIQDELQTVRDNTGTHIHSTNFLQFTNSSKQPIITSRANALADQLNQEFSYSNIVKGMILYNSQIDRYYTYFANTSASVDFLKISHQVLTPYFKQMDSQRTFAFYTLETNHTIYILYVINQRYGSLAVVISPEDNAVYQSFNELYEDHLVFVSDKDDTSTMASPIITDFDNLSLSLVYTNNNFMKLIGYNPIQIIALCSIILLFLATILAFNYLQHLLFNPLQHLSDSFTTIASGNTDYRITRTSNVYEINQFYQGFNDMLDALENEKSERHRQQMDAAQAKLQYLQLQIRPHFYLNCLKNINSLAQMHEDEKIQTLVISLSDYFRYNFQDVKNFVTVREELEAVQSYVDLCRCLYNEIELEFDIDSEVLGIKCLPLTILTFVENAIKHGKDLSQLVIKIYAGITINEDGEVYANIHIANTGHFDDEALTQLNDESPETVIYKKERVGISNVRYRMWLIYGKHFKLTFKNKDNDAIVQLQFPEHFAGC